MNIITKMKFIGNKLFPTKKARLISISAMIAIVSLLGGVSIGYAQFKGLIPFFGKVTGQSQVSQSIKLDDHIYGQNAAWTYTANNIAGGETVFNGPHFIRNTAHVPIRVKLETTPDSTNVIERIWHNVQITTGAKYTRNASFFKGQDGAYWLFFAQDTNGGQDGKGCDANGLNCDNDPYDISYTISLDKGQTWSAPIPFVKANNISTNRRDISAFQDNSGKIWVFVADGASNKPVFYLTSSNNGASWNGPVQVSTAIGNHMSALSVNNYIVLFYENAGINLVYSNNDGTSWTTPIKVDLRGGVPKAIHSSDGKIRVVWTNGGNGIYMSTCGDNNFGTATNWTTTAGPIAEASGYFDYDPYLFQDSYNNYWLVWAPWDQAQTQWLDYEMSSDGQNWSTPKILMKRSGLWNFWPMITENDNHNIMVFYTSENNYNTTRANGNIWLAETGNWWNPNVPLTITVPSNITGTAWIGADISNVFKDNTGAATYETVTEVKTP